MKRTNLLWAAILLPIATLGFADDAVPPVARKLKDTAEVSFVSTNGNSKTTTTSIKNSLAYNWTDLTGLEVLAGGLGSSDRNGVTAEQYNASEKVTHKLYGKNYVYQRNGWDKDRFAGIRNRYDLSAGLGRLLLDSPTDKINTELGGGYINEERTNAPRNDFGSGRAYGKYVHLFSPTASFSQDAEYLHNFSDRKAYRLNTETALIASITTHFSLKASFLWKRNAVPPPGAVKDDTTTGVGLLINY